MVMHARKQPRLNDGYADRKDAHLHQDMQYHSSLFVDGNDDDGPLGSRVSPRYQNKSSYIERNKEKRGSLSLAEKKVSHYLATGSLGRPIPLDSPGVTDGSGAGSSYHDQHRTSTSISASSHHRKERPHITGGSSRDYNSHHQSSSTATPHKDQAGREHNSHHTDRGEHRSQPSSTNNGKQTSTSSNKEVSALQVQKSAIRVCGDWSEHISSSGKRYYYNCKTEVSQWEKPKEWNNELEDITEYVWCKTPDHRSKDRQRTLSQTPHANKITAESRGSRHSSSSEHQHEHSRHRANSGDNNLGDPSSISGRDSSSATNAHYTHGGQFRDRERGGGGGDRNRLSVDSSNSNNSNLIYPHSTHHHHSQQHHHHHQRSGSTPGGNNGLSESHQDYSRHDSHHQSYPSSDYRRQSTDINRHRRPDSHGSHRYRELGQGPKDDMDISPSPSPSPSSSQPSSAAGTPQHNTSSGTPSSHHHHHHHQNSSTPQQQPQQRLASPQGNPIPTVVNRQTTTAAAPEGETYDETIQTLKKLQNALTMHIRAQQNTTTSSSRMSVSQPTVRHSHNTVLSVSNSGGMSGSISATHHQPSQQQQQQPPPHSGLLGNSPMPGITPQQQHLLYHHHQQQQTPQQQQGLLPLPHAHTQLYQQGQGQPQLLAGGVISGQSQQPQQEDGTCGRTSPVSATSSRSSCGSPTPSDSSSQNATVAGSSSQALTAAAMKREETAKLTASLSNYYNEKLISHVLGWQADSLEKQSSKLWEEWMVNGSLQASQISVQLKKARSQVRIAEIQSTLHEQRIMSSEQQRQEIENLKTPSNYLPS